MGELEGLSPRMRQDMFERLGKKRKQILWTGIAMAIIGVAAIIFPLFFSLSLTLLIGWFFIIAGVIGLYGSFSYHGTGPFFGAFILSLLQVAAGMFAVLNPGAALVVLTYMVALVLVIEGVFKLILAFQMKPEEGWGWTLFSALISIALGIMIATRLLESSTFIIGLFMGISFFSTGIFMIMLANRFKAD